MAVFTNCVFHCHTVNGNSPPQIKHTTDNTTQTTTTINPTVENLDITFTTVKNKTDKNYSKKQKIDTSNKKEELDVHKQKEGKRQKGDETNDTPTKKQKVSTPACKKQGAGLTTKQTNQQTLSAPLQIKVPSTVDNPNDGSYSGSTSPATPVTDEKQGDSGGTHSFQFSATQEVNAHVKTIAKSPLLPTPHPSQHIWPNTPRYTETPKRPPQYRESPLPYLVCQAQDSGSYLGRLEHHRDQSHRDKSGKKDNRDRDHRRK